MKIKCMSHVLKWCTLENPHCSVAMNTKQRSKIADIQQMADNLHYFGGL